MRQEKEAARLKAKKQRSSKNSVKKGYQLKYLLKAMKMAKSTYYFEISKSNIVFEKNKDLLAVIQQIFTQNKGRYGVRRVHKELVNRGYIINHKRV